MPRFQVTVIETYTSAFEVDAEDSADAARIAEAMAVERALPAASTEHCERGIEASPAGLQMPAVQPAGSVGVVAQAAGLALEAAHPWGYRSGDAAP